MGKVVVIYLKRGTKLEVSNIVDVMTYNKNSLRDKKIKIGTENAVI